MSDQPAFFRPRHVVVLAHPSSRSFNGLVANAYCEAVRQCGQEPIVRDLYAIGFDPLLKDSERPHEGGTSVMPDVKFEHAAIRGSDVFVLVYPIWFGMPPAMMKGYVDRVLGSGVTAKDMQGGVGTALLKDKRLVSITSSGASKAWLNQQGQIEALRNVFERYLAHGLGMKSVENLHFGETVEGLSEDYLDPLLAQVQDLARKVCADVDADVAAERGLSLKQRQQSDA
ncbi:NAD(P)H-dependent oxidoreductase [Sphingomonas sp. MMS24-J13]|uniref:NAD(P)H-dependent oxidoreductase n=1 Tax=Sphingomonas sp. MMS24-J13 TaxID=3238686 RepID=UPI00384A5247